MTTTENSRLNPGQFVYAIAALLGALVLGILQGVAMGIILSLVVLIRRVSHPATAVLGRLPGTNTYRDITVNPDAETISELLIFRFDARNKYHVKPFVVQRFREIAVAFQQAVKYLDRS